MCVQLVALLQWKRFYKPAWHVDYSKTFLSSHLNEIFSSNCVRSMTKAEDYQCMDVIFPFFCGYMDKDNNILSTLSWRKWTRCTLRICLICGPEVQGRKEIRNRACCHWNGGGENRVTQCLVRSKTIVNWYFLRWSYIFPMMFVMTRRRFAGIEYFDAAPWKNFKVVFNRA